MNKKVLILTPKEKAYRKKEMLRRRLIEKRTLRDIAKDFGVSHQAVGNIIGKTAHLKIKHIKWICPVCRQTQLMPPNETKGLRACSQECRQKLNKYGVARNDPEYERIRRKDPAVIKRQKAYFKKRWYNDSEYRKRRIKEMREYHRRNKK